ncbi:MAG TPA: diaminopimelate dehydrogenase [Limnochordia bacterium]|nr:diaminopimelate dehydrogenase [Limnochordia bacterium]
MIRVAVVGYGNIGTYAVRAIQAAPDLTLAGVVRRKVGDTVPSELAGISVVSDITELGEVDVALLCAPTRSVPAMARELVAQNINTVDSFDLHGDALVEYRAELGEEARKHRAVSVIAAGWDPGSDSLIRALMEVLAPSGLTFTNFGPGMSMGHSVAVKALPGVEDALSMTIPSGSGVHRRLVYVELAPGADFGTIEDLVREDAYFRHDETHVYQVESIAPLKDVGHGVRIERSGTSGHTANQNFKWEMRINNPALTAQVMVAAARASTKQKPGSYTPLEIPLVDYFSGDCDELIRRLV